MQKTVLFSYMEEDAVAIPITSPYPFALTPEMYHEKEEAFNVM